MDEPETYLHPDLHRRLYRLLKESANTVVLATHSSEILTEAEPEEVLVIDKTRRSAKRLANVDAALQAIGSSRTTTVTAVARTERVLFVEGDDGRILGQLAARAGKGDLAVGTGLTTIPLGGHRPKDAAAIAKGISEAIGTRAKFAIVLDKDFRCQEELAELHASLGTFCDLVHTHGRKEIENYALSPRGLLKAVRKAQERQQRFSGKDRVPVEIGDIVCVLAEVAEALRIDAQVQFVERRVDFLRSKGNQAHRVAIAREAVVEFEGDWSRSEARLSIIGGKSALAAVNAALAERYAVTLSVGSIVSELDNDELPGELTLFLSQLDRFRNHG